MYRKVFAIARRELTSSFATPFFYVVVAGFLLISGFFFFSILQQFNTIVYQASILKEKAPSLNEWVIIPYYHSLEVILVFLIPLLSMKIFAEEKRNGMFEMLVTSPLSYNQLMLGKYLGGVFVCSIMLGCSFVFPLVVIIFSDPEVLPVIVGFIGISLLAFSLLALGMAISATTKSQAAAGVLSIVFFLILYVLYVPIEKFEHGFLFFLKYLSPATHTEVFYNGVIQGSDLVYFMSLVLVGFFFTSIILAWWKRV